MSRTVITVKTNAQPGQRAAVSVRGASTAWLHGQEYPHGTDLGQKRWGHGQGPAHLRKFSAGGSLSFRLASRRPPGGIRSAGDRGQAHEEPSEAGTRPDSRRHRGPPRSPLCHPSERDLLQCLRKCLHNPAVPSAPAAAAACKEFQGYTNPQKYAILKIREIICGTLCVLKGLLS